MNDDPITLLARENPIPGPVTPRPFEELLTRLESDAALRPSHSGQRRRDRVGSSVVPTLGVAVTLAVIVAAIFVLRPSPGPVVPSRQPNKPPAPTTTSTPSIVPKGGMRGTVTVQGVAFGVHDDGFVSLQQSLSGRTGNWLATTHDDGVHWKVEHVGYEIQDPEFAGAKDGWAFGISASREAVYFVTHNGGVSWTPAHLSHSQIADTTPLAVAGGRTWAIGSSCAIGPSCSYTVMRGTASRSTLSPTSAQPAPHAQTMTITAGSSTTAYATGTYDGGRRAVTYASHDGGKTWAKITSACLNSQPAAAGATAVWEICPHREVAVSTNGGRHWTRHRSSLGVLAKIVPISNTVAWAVTDQDAFIRTSDGGRTWHGYLFPARQTTSSGTRGTFSPLTALDADSAAVAYDYRTKDRTQIFVGRAIGPGNPSSFVKLPPGLPGRRSRRAG